ncbi:hypothetical protein ACKTEK_12010 [Tepidamorphus sp. 3E244]|uniref:hypothetical protein n=1 Tax=Tepidamorphus sp. 3E244 TaxID=3385498 RepID=UPI0038FCA2D0
MTDFNSVLRRAIGNLPENTVAARRQLYARAETALVAQLQKSDPPADAEHIAKMRENLRAAVRTIEAEEAAKGPALAAPPERPAVAPPAQPAAIAPPAQPGSTPRPSIPGSPGYVSPQRQRPDQFLQPAASPTPPPPNQRAQPDPDAPAVQVDPAQLPNQPVSPGYSNAPSVEMDDDGFAPPPGVPEGPEDDQHFDDWPDPGAYELETRSRPWGWLIALFIVGCIAGVGYWKRDAIMDAAAPLLALIQQEGADDEKVEARLPGDGENAGQDAPAAPDQPAEPAPEPPAAPPGEAVIEALLVEEGETAQATPAEVPGSVTWTLNRENGIPVIEGRVRVPSRDFALSVMIRKNTDPAFPATHTIDFVFSIPPGFGGGGINNVPGLLTKTTPKARGGPLAGEVVRVDDGIFLMALLAGDQDTPRNIQAMSQHPFLDVPMVYANGQRAIVTMAKGPEGEQVFREAFAEWGQNQSQ